MMYYQRAVQTKESIIKTTITAAETLPHHIHNTHHTTGTHFNCSVWNNTKNVFFFRTVIIILSDEKLFSGTHTYINIIL